MVKLPMMLPNTLIRSYLNTLEDLLGKNGVNTILNLSGLSGWIENYPPEDSNRAVPFEAFTKIQTSLDEIYGERTGQNLSMSAAQKSFLEVGDDLMGLDLSASSDMGSTMNIKDALNAFVAMFDDGSGSVYWSGDKEDIQIIFKVCPSCLDRESQTPICRACTGWIEGFAACLNIGEKIEVVEEHCLASGDASCSFKIAPG
jgi:predicted hydrocarbon binding protein